MAQDSTARLADLISRNEAAILQDWIAEQTQNGTSSGAGRISESQLREEASEFLRLFRNALQAGARANTSGSDWSAVRELLVSLSRSRAKLGFSPADTATFVFSLKSPLFKVQRQGSDGSIDTLFEDIWQTTLLIDSLGLYTTEMYQKSREEIISRQQEEMLELSTPVVKLWDGILALPLIGTLDFARTQVVMESLLQAIVDTGSAVAIIDITGVPTVDTLVSQHLLKTVAAARLMGAECIISGIRPQIAQTIVHLGVDLSAVSTKASLADAFVLALQKTGQTIGRGARTASQSANVRV